ncbi:MAG: amino acid permease [Thermoanaerobaculia bacterium]|jgi:APA family basic amino acid/polyamine antiporter
MSDTTSARPKLGFWMTTALVVGNMIGSGVFLLPSSLARYGALSIVAWLFTAAGSVLLALVFARLATMVSGAGGPYTYARAGFGDFIGFLVGWGYWLSIWTSNAAIATAFTGYLTVFWAAPGKSNALAAVVTVTLIWILTAVNVAGVRVAGAVQLVTTLLKALPLLVVAAIGLARLQPSQFTPFNPSGEPLLAAFSAAAALTLWAFLGLESATVPADDVENPERTIPRATIAGTLFAAVIYIASSTAVLGVIPRDVLATSTAPFADAARLLLGDWAAYLIAAGAVISTLGALNGWILMQGQMPVAAARDGLAPPAFGRLSKNGTPALALVSTSAIVTVIVLMNYTRGLVAMFTFLILLATLMTLVPYVFSSMALLVLARERSATKRIPAGILVVGGLAFAYSLWAVGGAGKDAVYWGMLLLLGSVPVYVMMRREAPWKS